LYSVSNQLQLIEVAREDFGSGQVTLSHTSTVPGGQVYWVNVVPISGSFVGDQTAYTASVEIY